MTLETTDPVCKMHITVGPDTPRAVHAGEQHYFCSKRCQEKFQTDPSAYLQPQTAAIEHPGGVYTCPMHPEIRQPEPCNCPKCGMTLVPASPANAAVLARPLRFGTGASALLLAIYFGVVGLISGMSFALDQFATFWYFIVPLALGFGLQVGLYTHLKSIVGKHGTSGKVVAVSGTTSTAAMVSCCSHYLVNILPMLGVTGFLAVVVEYQIEVFWLGLAFNAAGVIYILTKVVVAYREHDKC